jgi:hypothetical protein
MFRIREILTRLRIIRSVPEKNGPDMDFCHESYLFGGIEMQENSKMYHAL